MADHIIEELTEKMYSGKLFWLGTPIVPEGGKRRSMRERREEAANRFQRIRRSIPEDLQPEVQTILRKNPWDSSDLKYARALYRYIASLGT